jgi:hypothetical protein
MKIPTKNFTLAKTYFKTNIRTGGFEERNDFPQEFDVKTVDNQIISNQWVGLIKILRTIGGYSLMDAKHKVDACRMFDVIDRLAMWTQIMDTIEQHNEIVVKKKKDDKIKVVVCVSGGNVQAIFSNDPTIVIKMVDHDNLKAEGKNVDELTQDYKDAIGDMKQVY